MIALPRTVTSDGSPRKAVTGRKSADVSTWMNRNCGPLLHAPAVQDDVVPSWH
jgi:hypothetical protein